MVRLFRNFSPSRLKPREQLGRGQGPPGLGCVATARLDDQAVIGISSHVGPDGLAGLRIQLP
jgi:hypothetical protein